MKLTSLSPAQRPGPDRARRGGLMSGLRAHFVVQIPDVWPVSKHSLSSWTAVLILALLPGLAQAVTVTGTYGAGSPDIVHQEAIITQSFTVSSGANFKIQSTTSITLAANSAIQVGAALQISINSAAPPPPPPPPPASGIDWLASIDPRLSGVSAWNDIDMSSDGRLVAITARRSHVYGPTSPDPFDLFIIDRQARTFWRVQKNGVVPNGGIGKFDLSDDGSAIAFISHATNIHTTDEDGKQPPIGTPTQLYKCRFGSTRSSDVIRAVSRYNDFYVGSIRSPGAFFLATGNQASVEAPSVSANGSRVVFVSSAGTGLPGTETFTLQEQNRQLYLWDEAAPGTGRISLVSHARSQPSTAGNGPISYISGPGALQPWMSDDGNSVTFTSRANNISVNSGSPNLSTYEGVYIYNLSTLQATRIVPLGAVSHWHDVVLRGTAGASGRYCLVSSNGVFVTSPPGIAIYDKVLNAFQLVSSFNLNNLKISRNGRKVLTIDDDALVDEVPNGSATDNFQSDAYIWDASVGVVNSWIWMTPSVREVLGIRVSSPAGIDSGNNITVQCGDILQQDTNQKIELYTIPIPTSGSG